MHQSQSITNFARRYALRFFATTAAWAAAVAVVNAQAAGGPVLNLKAPKSVGDKFDSLDHAIANGFQIVITVAGVLFMVLFLLGGMQYLAGAGNEETTKKARQLMLDSVIGLGIVVTAWAAGTYVLQLLGLGAGGLRT